MLGFQRDIVNKEQIREKLKEELMAVCDITVIPSGRKIKDVYSAVDSVIDIIARSGLKYEVGAMSTSVEGDPGELFRLAEKCHSEAFQLGADDVITIFRIHQSRKYDDSIDGKVAKHRQK